VKPTEPPIASADDLAAVRDAINGPELDEWIDRQIERHEGRGRVDSDSEGGA
jgi:hypothetical protein